MSHYVLMLSFRLYSSIFFFALLFLKLFEKITHWSGFPNDVRTQWTISTKYNKNNKVNKSKTKVIKQTCLSLKLEKIFYFSLILYFKRVIYTFLPLKKWLLQTVVMFNLFTLSQATFDRVSSHLSPSPRSPCLWALLTRWRDSVSPLCEIVARQNHTHSWMTIRWGCTTLEDNLILKLLLEN